MRKLLLIALAALCLAGCGTTTEVVVEPVHEYTMYLVPGHYYASGDVLTEDGNIWGYSQGVISDEPSYDNEPVYVIFCDEGTPDHIYDDAIIGLISR